MRGRSRWDEPDDSAASWDDLAVEQENALREGRRELDAMIAETGEIRADFHGAKIEDGSPPGGGC